MTLAPFSLVVLWCISGAFGSREKRIILGTALPNVRDSFVYQAVRYTVWIGDGRIAPSLHHRSGPYADIVVADPPHLWCTGVLITPEIVQTTCSCVSFFILDGYNNYHRVRARVMTPWEDRLEVFFGETSVERMRLFIYAKSYIVYNQCAKVYLPAMNDPDRNFLSYIVHDYGLIVMEKPVSDVPEAEISYAPQQPFEDIINFYHEALKREYLCLFFGYGHANETKTYGIPGWGENSKYLRFTWRALINYQDCYYATYKDPVDHRKVSKNVDFQYARDATWMCANSLLPKSKPESGSTSPKDRGGPVTCNNVYLGLISDSFWYHTVHTRSVEKPKIKLSLVAPIVFNLWESSSNYRQRFLQDIRRKLWTGETNLDPFDDITHSHPTYKLFSSRSPRINISHFLLIFLSISKLLHS